MARAGQRVIAGRRMQQRIEAVADEFQNSHGSRASACSSQLTCRNAPFIVASTCQSELKRTLRRPRRPQKTARRGRICVVRVLHSARMVNATFPKRNRYGFEMVDGLSRTFTIAKAASIENLRRIESFGFFTNFPRFRFNADTCGLSAQFKKRVDCEINRSKGRRQTGSRNVFPASHGILARTGAGAAAQREDA
jgi:hypothetical protein